MVLSVGLKLSFFIMFYFGMLCAGSIVGKKWEPKNPVPAFRAKLRKSSKIFQKYPELKKNMMGWMGWDKKKIRVLFGINY